MFAGAAWASPIPALAQGDTATFSITDNGFGGYDLISTGTVTVLLIDATHLNVSVTLNNVSTNDDGSAISAANANNVRLAVWGFAITPDVTAVSFVDAADNGMIGAALGDIPSQKAIEVCAFGQNCSSGANLGILANASDTFELDMTGTFGVGSTISLDLLGVKWQTDKGSFEFSCSDCGVTETSSSTGSTSSTTSSTGGTGTSGQVPEPSSSALALLGLAMLGATFMKRRSSQRS
jgi:hypothetical protein